MIKLFLFVVIFVTAAGFGLNWVTPKLSGQSQFVKGKYPDPAPSGDYKGSAIVTGPWRGKSFDPKKHTGINLIDEKGKIVKKFAFKTYKGKGIQDTKLDVLKIDYDVPENPIWLHPILDEIVQTSKNTYIGKVSIRIPNHPISIAFFKLQKGS